MYRVQLEILVVLVALETQGPRVHQEPREARELREVLEEKEIRVPQDPLDLQEPLANK